MKYRVMHIDDSYDALKLFEMKFKNTFQIASVEDPEKALSILEFTKFDLIITDYDLPMLSGLELLKQIKKEYPDIPVIFYTGQGNEEVAREAFICGVSDYITKSLREIAHWEKLENAIKNAIEKKNANETARESQRQLKTLIGNIPGMVYRCRNDQFWTMEFASENTMELTGYTPWEIINNKVISFSEIIHPYDRGRVWNGIQEKILSGKPFSITYRINTKEEGIKYVMERGRPIFDQEGVLVALEGVILDDTQRNIAETETKHLNKILKAVSEINQLIVREKDFDKLTMEACDILKKFGEYSLVWIGLTKEDGITVIPISFSGEKNAFLEEADCASGMHSTCHNPVHLALRNKKTIIIQDIKKQAESDYWSKKAIERGFLSFAAMPLVSHEKVYGSLNIYSSETNSFKDEEISVLEELSNDIAFALNAIEQEKSRRKSEKEKQESETKYRTLLEYANDGVFLESLDGRILEANTKACEMLGYTRDELLQLNVVDLLPESLRKNITPLLKELIAKGKFCMQSLNKKKDGTLIPVEASGSVLEIDGKRQVIAIVRDISERIVSKNIMEKSMAAIEAAPHGVVVIDKMGKINLYNRKLEEISGYASSEIPDIFTWLRNLIPDESKREKVNVLWNEMIRNNDYEGYTNVEVERRDGRKRIFRIFGKNAGNDEILIFIVDVTERILSEKALRRSEEKYRLLFENSGDAIILSDRETGCILEVNRQTEVLLGSPPGEITGKRFKDPELFKNFRELKESQEKNNDNYSANNIRTELEMPDGRRIPVIIWSGIIEIEQREILMTIVKDISHKVAGVRGVIQDIFAGSLQTNMKEIKGDN